MDGSAAPMMDPNMPQPQGMPNMPQPAGVADGTLPEMPTNPAQGMAKAAGGM
jgi:hypothetical protein